MDIERQALTTFFNETGGDSWKIKDGWCTEAPLGEWYGVKTNNEGSVVRLVLEGNNLIGKEAFIDFSLQYLRVLRKPLFASKRIVMRDLKQMARGLIDFEGG